ncbi:MAG: hypothetical protein J7521_20560 [Caulobacter sp.]|nr:hypothetical protein [Caulobacter sp.]
MTRSLLEVAAAALFLLLLLGWPVFQFVALPLWIWRTTPVRDALRIKRDFEGQGRNVTKVHRRGIRWGGRGVPTYRLYDVTVRRHDGAAADFKAGVAFTFGPDPDLLVDDEARWKTFRQGSHSHF